MTDTDRDGDTGRFIKGKKGGPGRPKGSRNALGEDFISALQADFREHGPETIERVREEKPSDYVKVVASLLPKEHIVRKPMDEMTDDELAERIDALEQIIAFSRDGEGVARPTHEGSGTA